MNKIDDLREGIMDVTIPERLDAVVENALLTGRRRHKLRKIKIRLVGVAASLAVVVAAANFNSVISNALSELPIIGEFVKVITFRDWHIEEGTMALNLSVPHLDGIGNNALEAELNDKYLKEYEALYDAFVEDMKALEGSGAHLGIDANFFIVTDTPRVFTLGRYYVNTVGSSSTTIAYDNVDPELGVLLELSDFFTDDSYIEVISGEIRRQMGTQMATNPQKAYFTDENGKLYFERIESNQAFYITAEGHLKISFDKYVVAPGSMGVVEFEIPYTALKGLLRDQVYIRP